MKIYKYSACTDCALYIANGDDSLDHLDSDVEREEIMRGVALIQEVDKCHLVTTGTDLGFYRCNCDICNRPTGGDRHLVHGLY